jgi:type II secretory pathway component PulF
MIEPIAIVFIGGLIGALLVAMYSPMLNMGAAMSGSM